MNRFLNHRHLIWVNYLSIGNRGKFCWRSEEWVDYRDLPDEVGQVGDKSNFSLPHYPITEETNLRPLNQVARRNRLKFCSKCLQLKEFDDFNANRGGADNLRSVCRDCDRVPIIHAPLTEVERYWLEWEKVFVTLGRQWDSEELAVIAYPRICELCDRPSQHDLYRHRVDILDGGDNSTYNLIHVCNDCFTKLSIKE